MPEPIETKKLSCKIRIQGAKPFVDGIATVVVYSYEPIWRGGSKEKPGIQPDGSFVPGGPNLALGGKTFPTGFKFWFGSAEVATDWKNVQDFMDKPVEMVLEDGRTLLARVIKTLSGNDFAMVFFIGINSF